MSGKIRSPARRRMGHRGGRPAVDEASGVLRDDQHARDYSNLRLA
jgi:hypothetical protein